jgi:hypothetical protein
MHIRPFSLYYNPTYKLQKIQILGNLFPLLPLKDHTAAHMNQHKFIHTTRFKAFTNTNLSVQEKAPLTVRNEVWNHI